MAALLLISLLWESESSATAFWEGCCGNSTHWTRKRQTSFQTHFLAMGLCASHLPFRHLSLLVCGMMSLHSLPLTPSTWQRGMSASKWDSPSKNARGSWWRQAGHSHVETSVKGQCESGSFTPRYKQGGGTWVHQSVMLNWNCLKEKAITMWPSPTMTPLTRPSRCSCEQRVCGQAWEIL